MDRLDHKAPLDCGVKQECQAPVHQVQSVLLGREEMLDCPVYQE